MKENEKLTPMVSIPITATHLQNVAASDGSARVRIPIGNYKWKVVNVFSRVKEGDRNPHTMSVWEVEVIAAYEAGNVSAVGQRITLFLAGSPQSPPFMQARLKNVIQAIGVVPGPQGINVSDAIGREFDGTIVWELSKQTIDATGQPRQYVNDRLKGERKIGLRSTINATLESAKAIEFLNREGDATTTEPFAWDNPTENTASIASAVTADPTPPTTTVAPNQPEDDGPAVSAYRAIVQMNHAAAPEALEMLNAAKIDPNGPVDATQLQPELATQWAAFQRQQKTVTVTIENSTPKAPILAGLPPLGNGEKRRGRPPKATTV